MVVLELLATVVVVSAAVYMTRQKPPCVCPYIERVSGRWPSPPATPEERLNGWKWRYGRVPLDMTVMPVGRFTKPNTHDVSEVQS